MGAGKAGIANPGAHGFSEILYALTSAGNNNGSAFAGLSANTPFYNTLLGIAMWLGRFGVIVPVLAIAGALARRFELLPGVVGGQVELAGAARNADAAANAHQPVVLGQRLAGFARGSIECFEAGLNLTNDLVQRSLGNGRVAPVTHEYLFLLFGLRNF